jgi:hypothetical protein
MAFGGLLLANVLFLTEVWQHSILRAGLELAPAPAAALAAAVLASRLGPRLGMSTLGGLGGLLVATGILVTAARVGLTPDYLGDLLPGQLVTGAGVGLSIPAFTATAVAAAGSTRFYTAIGVTSMFQQVGAALGVAAFVAIVGTPAPEAAIAAFRSGWIFMAVAAAVGGLVILSARYAAEARTPATADAST